MNRNSLIINIAVFSSGTGTNFKSIHSKCISNKINSEIKLLISNNESSGSVEYAKINNIPVLIYNKHNVNDNDLLAELNNNKIDLILLAGFVKKIPHQIVLEYYRKILNVHPSLLPKYGGKNYYGMNVHKAVIDAGEKESGVTIHFIDEQYDTGPIVAQKRVSVHKNDDEVALASRILKQEHILFFNVIKAFCENRIKWEDNVPIIITKELV